MNQLRGIIQRVNRLGLPFQHEGVTYWLADSEAWQQRAIHYAVEFEDYLPPNAIIADMSEAGSPIIHLLDGTEGVCNLSRIPQSTVKEVILPDTLKCIHNFTFAKLNIESCIIPDSVIGVGINAFVSCKHLRSCTLPNDLAELGEVMFGNCFQLRAIKLPDNLREISQRAFIQSGLEEIILPPRVQSIWEYAFYGCANLTRVVLNNGLLHIDCDSFGDCPKLTEVVIPETVQHLSVGAFYRCANLQTVWLPQHLQDRISVDFLKQIGNPRCRLRWYTNSKEVKL